MDESRTIDDLRAEMSFEVRYTEYILGRGQRPAAIVLSPELYELYERDEARIRGPGYDFAYPPRVTFGGIPVYVQRGARSPVRAEALPLNPVEILVPGRELRPWPV